MIVGLHYVVTGARPGIEAGAWYFLLERLNPLEAYRVIVGGLLDERVRPVPDLPLEDVPMRIDPDRLDIANRVAGEVPFYLQDWFAAIVLLAWGPVPVLIGYRRFVGSDVG